MALLGRKKSTVGLDIGSGLIKVAVVDHSKKGQPELTSLWLHQRWAVDRRPSGMLEAHGAKDWFIAVK